MRLVGIFFILFLFLSIALPSNTATWRGKEYDLKYGEEASEQVNEIVNESYELFLNFGLSEEWAEEHIILEGVSASSHQVQIFWVLTVGVYVASISDSVLNPQREPREHSLYHTLEKHGRLHDIRRTIPRAEALKILEDCLPVSVLIPGPRLDDNAILNPPGGRLVVKGRIYNLPGRPRFETQIATVDLETGKCGKETVRSATFPLTTKAVTEPFGTRWDKIRRIFKAVLDYFFLFCDKALYPRKDWGFL